MSEQLQFEFMELFKRKYIAPDYIKFYTVYQYDRIKFKKLLRKEIARLKPKSDEEFKEIQNRILIECYIRDENGKRKRDTDEKHIFRYRSLENILNYLYNKLGPRADENVCSCFFDAKEIILYPDEEQAEIKGTERLPVFERIKIHIRLLRKVNTKVV